MGLPGQNIVSSSYYIHYDTHYIYFCGNFQACCTRLFIRNVVLTSMKILQNYWTPGGKLYHYFPLKFWLHVSYTHTHSNTLPHTCSSTEPKIIFLTPLPCFRPLSQEPSKMVPTKVLSSPTPCFMSAFQPPLY